MRCGVDWSLVVVRSLLHYGASTAYYRLRDWVWGNPAVLVQYADESSAQSLRPGPPRVCHRARLGRVQPASAAADTGTKRKATHLAWKTLAKPTTVDTSQILKIAKRAKVKL